MVMLSMIVVIAAFVYRSIITSENNQIYEIEFDNRTTPIPRPIEPDFTVSISPDKLNSSNAILIQLIDNSVLMQKIVKKKFIPLL